MKQSQTHLSSEAISAFVDGELSASARGRAARHIQTCFECAYAVGVQQQAKESLTCGGGDVDVPTNLLSRLGDIPFSADLGAGGLDDVGLYADESGRFAFRVAAPAAAPKTAGTKDARPGSDHRRGRAFRSSAAAVAVASVIAGPIAAQQSYPAPRGHQIHVGNVLARHADQVSSDLAR